MSDTPKVHAVTLANNEPGPRYAWTMRGMEVVQAGNELTTEVNADQLRALRGEVIENTDPAVERWTITSADGDDLEFEDGPQEKPLSELSVTKLRAIAGAEGYALTDRPDPADPTKKLPDATSAKAIIDVIEKGRAAKAAG